jgi:threonyl-tRNA synthetase
LRVRGFTQDDAHIFCTAEQVEDEVVKLLGFTERLLRKFGFKEYHAILSTKDPKQPDKYMGSERKWRHAQEALATALKKMHIAYREMPGEAVFYGPKIDLNIVDAAGREWQCTTIQFDFNLPKRFSACYIGVDSKEREVVMIHRALLGSIERFFAILIEHYNGNFPVWLAPTQVAILPVSNDYVHYAEEIQRKLQAHEIRSELDDSPSTISYKIRSAELQKIPYMIICGKREVETKKVAVRKHGTGNMGSLTISEFVKSLQNAMQLDGTT